MDNEPAIISEGTAPRRERWPFGSLKPGQFFTCSDLEQHAALRTAASRAQKKYACRFSVRKVKTRSGKSVLRVFMQRV